MGCMFLGYTKGFIDYRLCFLDLDHMRCITSRYVVLNEAEMVFKKTDDIGLNAVISAEELE